MQQIYKVLWSLAIFILVVTAVTFFAGISLIAIGVLGLFGIYRYYLKGRSSRKFKTKPYSSGEIIDVKAEVVNNKIQAQDPKR